MKRNKIYQSPEMLTISLQTEHVLASGSPTPGLTGGEDVVIDYGGDDDGTGGHDPQSKGFNFNSNNWDDNE
jgi:hypothetical protein